MRRIALASLPVLALPLLLLGCSSDEAAEAAASGSGTTAGSSGSGGGATTGAGGGATTGTGTGSGGAPIGGDRPVDVYVPASHDPATPAPLVILLHGYTATGAIQEAYFKLEAEAEARGFLYAHPDGTKENSANAYQFWNATEACCNFFGSTVDDSAYLRLVIDDIKAAYNVDPKRVFVLGHSNGGFMSYRMACDHADAIAAIASLAGATWNDAADCAPSEPVAVLQIHGTADATVAFDGGQFFPGGPTYPSAQGSAERWAAIGGCSMVTTAGASLDLENSLPADAMLPPEETTVTIWSDGCDPGGHAELWTIEGGSHIPGLTPDFPTKVIDFLFAHPKP